MQVIRRLISPEKSENTVALWSYQNTDVPNTAKLAQPIGFLHSMNCYFIAVQAIEHGDRNYTFHF